MKPCRATARAEADIDATIDWYLKEATADVASRFLSVYDHALEHIAQFPGTGSTRYAEPGDKQNLRFWLLDPFPYGVFYVERKDFIEVVRVLHQASDIPAHLEN